jgi:ribosome-associated protein|tara:strand:+ start:2525 stop:3016 length:492 start_codon:yes stop_codon:yes gene_type:complete
MLDIDTEIVISKTELKKDSKKIQDFGRKISQLTIKNIEIFNFSSKTYEAIIDLKNLKSNSAKKRQVQYVGKLLRETDLTYAFLIMKQLKVSSQKEIQKNHTIEKWRDKLLSSADSITEFFDEYPNINRQLIRQAITNAQKEKKEEKPPKYSRQLFKIIKDIIV